VQGYDAGLLLAAGLKAVNGDMSKKKELDFRLGKSQELTAARRVTMSKAHNPIQDIYLRKVVGKENKVTGVAHKALGRSGARLQRWVEARAAGGSCGVEGRRKPVFFWERQRVVAAATCWRGRRSRPRGSAIACGR